jgi:hypothetical protein
MQDTIEAIHVLANPSREGGEVVDGRDIQLDDGRLDGEPGGTAPSERQGAAEGREHDGGTLLLGEACDMKCDRLIRQHTRHQDALAFENPHDAASP